MQLQRENLGSLIVLWILLGIAIGLVGFFIYDTGQQLFMSKCERTCYEKVNNLKDAYYTGFHGGISSCDDFQTTVERHYCFAGALDKITNSDRRTNIRGILDTLRNYCKIQCKEN